MTITQSQFIDSLPSSRLRVMKGGNISYTPTRLERLTLGRRNNSLMRSSLRGDEAFPQNSVAPAPLSATTVPTVEDEGTMTGMLSIFEK